MAAGCGGWGFQRITFSLSRLWSLAFARSNSSIRRLTSECFAALSSSERIKWYKDYKEQLCTIETLPKKIKVCRLQLVTIMAWWLTSDNKNNIICLCIKILPDWARSSNNLLWAISCSLWIFATLSWACRNWSIMVGLTSWLKSYLSYKLWASSISKWLFLFPLFHNVRRDKKIINFLLFHVNYFSNKIFLPYDLVTCICAAWLHSRHRYCWSRCDDLFPSILLSNLNRCLLLASY